MYWRARLGMGYRRGAVRLRGLLRVRHAKGGLRGRIRPAGALPARPAGHLRVGLAPPRGLLAGQLLSSLRQVPVWHVLRWLPCAVGGCSLWSGLGGQSPSTASCCARSDTAPCAARPLATCAEPRRAPCAAWCGWTTSSELQLADALARGVRRPRRRLLRVPLRPGRRRRTTRDSSNCAACSAFP
jgi:hypothetical protein